MGLYGREYILTAEAKKKKKCRAVNETEDHLTRHMIDVFWHPGKTTFSSQE